MGLRAFVAVDPEVIREIFLGLATNGLAEVAGRAADRRRGGPDVSAIDAAVKGAVAEMTDVEEILPSLGGEELRDFLRSAETHKVVRQIFATGDGRPLDDIRREFYGLWRVRAGDSTEMSKAEVDRLFLALVELCDRSLDKAIEAGSLTALELKEARRHAEVRASFESLDQMLSVLVGSSKPNIAEIEKYAAEYRRQVAEREGTIVPPTLDSAYPVPIDSLYVPALLEEIDALPPNLLSYEEFAQSLFRRVVLGDPGSGKSTLARKLAVDLARGQRSHDMVPFLVVVRDFGARKLDDPCSIVDFIVSTSDSKYQLEPARSTVEYLLLTDRAMVIFDGLDELLDTAFRAEIAADIESFASLYPSLPILVTSRMNNYQQAPLSPSVFTGFQLTSFSDGQAKQYARNWFAIDEERSAEEAQGKAMEFMADSSGVPDLRSNALMLALMCNLYKGSDRMPHNRPEVYAACAEMLFDRWDTTRHIGEPLGSKSLLLPTMQYLAAWIYSDVELQSGVGERKLVAKTKELLLERGRFDNDEDAELEARRFVEFYRGRGWVLTHIGSTISGEHQYQFTHRTFLEFFTAGHHVRAYPTAESLLAVLEPHISVAEWDVVAQLAFQLLEQEVEGSADALLSGLSHGDVDIDDASQANRIDFAVRTLEFLVPSSAVTASLTERALVSLMQLCASCGGADERRIDGDIRDRTVLSLAKASPWNTRAVRDALVKGIDPYLSEPATASYAAELILNLRLHEGAAAGFDASPIAETATEQALEEYGDQLRTVGHADRWVGTDLVLVGALDPGSYVADHGVEPLLQSRLYRLFPGTVDRTPLSEIAIGSVLWEFPAEMPLESSLGCLTALAPHLTLEEPAKMADDDFMRGSWLYEAANAGWTARHIDIRDLSPDQRYAFLMLMILFFEEQLTERGSLSWNVYISESSAGTHLWDAALPVLEGRAAEDADEALAAVDDLELSGDQREVLRRWIQGEVSFSSS
jgi:hypothetical protein